MPKATELTPLTRAERELLKASLEQRLWRDKRQLFDNLFPSTGPLRLALYKKHKEFFDWGADRRERCFLSANRVGKTVSGGYEMVCHLTGRYPDWWAGRRFEKPIRGLVAGDTLDTVKDIIEVKLLGAEPDDEDWGTGLIPHDTLGEFTRRSGKKGSISEVKVKHTSGGWSVLKLRSYDQGRKIFQGTELEVAWLDEEVPKDVYDEALVRTMTTGGIVMLTFTPLQGLTELVLEFMPGGDPTAAPTAQGKVVVMAGWDDAPHLSEGDKQELLDSLPPHQRDARSKGVPSLGAGAIYPVAEADIVVAPFKIPAYWPRAYGFDVGWNKTAAVWGAIDRETDTVYLYSEHYRGQAEPPIHAAGVKARGSWIPGAIDPASRGRQQSDGTQLLKLYRQQGLVLHLADNGVESGIYEVWQRLSTGRLKVFNTLANWLSEYRIYRRDRNGKIIKENDHLMDCLHPDTLVITDQGKVPIKKLVGKSGKVMTAEGRFVDFFNCRLTRRDTPTVDVGFADGSRVVCTPDHKFLTTEGWVEAQHMSGADCLNTASYAEELKLCKLQKYQIGSRSFWGKFTGSVASIFSAMGRGCTESFTSTATGESRRATTFTTLMATGPTTSQRTLNLCDVGAIQATTKKGIKEARQALLPMLRKPGTAVKMVVNGIKNTMPLPLKSFMKSEILFVNIAGPDIGLRSLEGIDFAQTTAKLRHEWCLASMMKQDNARCAETSFQSTNIHELKPVPDHAVVSCLNVKDKGLSDTYCMEVPDGMAFAVENGAVVHNCTRYLITTGIDIAKVAPAQRIDERITGSIVVDATTNY